MRVVLKGGGRRGWVCCGFCCCSVGGCWVGGGIVGDMFFFWVLFARGFGVSFPGSFNAVEVVRARRRFVGVFQKTGYQVSVVGL